MAALAAAASPIETSSGGSPLASPSAQAPVVDPVATATACSMRLIELVHGSTSSLPSVDDAVQAELTALVRVTGAVPRDQWRASALGAVYSYRTVMPLTTGATWQVRSSRRRHGTVGLALRGSCLSAAMSARHASWRRD